MAANSRPIGCGLPGVARQSAPASSIRVGWRLTDPKADNGWSVRDGLLVNNNVQEEGKPHKHFGNLRTDSEFDDFNLKLEVRYPEHGNSGIYLRGIYEVQVEDNYGKPP